MDTVDISIILTYTHTKYNTILVIDVNNTSVQCFKEQQNFDNCFFPRRKYIPIVRIVVRVQHSTQYQYKPITVDVLTRDHQGSRSSSYNNV